jgi:hypothetical protein
VLQRCPEEFIDLQIFQVLSYQHSLNQPQISPGDGRPSQIASCGVFELSDLQGARLFFVALFFPTDHTRTFYRIEAPSGAEAAAAKQEIDAFTAEMGFLMTDSKFSDLEPEARTKLLRLSPFLYKDVKLYFQALTQSEVRFKHDSVELVAKREVELDRQQQFIDQYVTILSML